MKGCVQRQGGIFYCRTVLERQLKKYSDIKTIPNAIDQTQM